MEKMIEKIDNLFKDIPDKPLGFICFLKENLKDIYDKLNIKSVYILLEIYNNTQTLKFDELIYGIEKEITEKSFHEKIKKTSDYQMEIIYIPKFESFSEKELELIKYINKNIFINFLLGLNKNLKLKTMYNNFKFDTNNIPSLINSFNKFDDNKKGIYSLIGLDIRKLKNYNHKYGMERTDVLLTKYFLKVKDFLDIDEYLVRPRGSHLIILAKDENVDKIINYIKCINIVYDDIEENMKSVSAVIKIEKNSDIFESYEMLLYSINKAKYENKSFVYIDKETIEYFEIVKRIKNRFEKALENEEFIIYYQPKVDTINKKLYGAEALVRWVSEGEMISPGIFIPILEQENLISELDYYVLDKTCKNIRYWFDLGLNPIKISINFARNHLKDIDFSNKVLEIIDSYSIPHEYIEIEITETSIYKDVDSLKLFVDKMKLNKINVSIDDFGTGYSSLSFFKDIDINTIKIDKTFIDNIYNEKNIIIIAYMIKMMNDLNIEIIGEGIETFEQIEFLKNLGCHIIQGYYYDKPMLKEEFEKRLANPYYKKEY